MFLTRLLTAGGSSMSTTLVRRKRPLTEDAEMLVWAQKDFMYV